MELLQRGVYPTMITPYTKTGEIDYDMAAALVDWYACKGCRGVFAVCQSSEVAYLSLHERVRLARTVVEAAAGRLDVVASGHISESPQAQAEEIMAVAETGVRAVVLVSNRLDPRQDGDAVWLQRAETLLSRLPQELMLGIYECPQPYKRLLTPVILDWCVETGRFAFIKDTCCDPAELTARLQRLRGTGVGQLGGYGYPRRHDAVRTGGQRPAGRCQLVLYGAGAIRSHLAGDGNRSQRRHAGGLSGGDARRPAGDGHALPDGALYA